MYVSQILGLNNPNNYGISPKKVKNNRNVSFQSNYAAKFQEGVMKDFKRVNPDVFAFCMDMVQQIKSERGVVINSILARINPYSQESLTSLMKALCTKGDTVLVNDIHGKSLVESSKSNDYSSLFFSEPSSNDYISIEKDGPSYKLTKGSTDGYSPIEIYRFYDFNESSSGRLKSYTKVSGFGYGALSETTYYNKDGSVREGRTLLNRLFGI